MRIPLLLVLVVIGLFVGPSFGFTSGINSVVSSLADYQTKTGGFRATKDAEPTLESTAQALFLSSLFGLRDKINSGAVPAFIQSLNNPDHGFSNQPGQPSDLESVRYALLSLTHLGNPIALNTAGLGAFIESLYDTDTNLYSNTFGGTGDVKSTALAFQTLASLNLLQSVGTNDKQVAIKKLLESLIKTDNSTKYFSSLTADNYYAIVVAQYVGIQFNDPTPWATYFRERQVQDGPSTGGFFSDQTHNEVVLEDAYHAVSALHVLQEVTKSTTVLTDSINTEALIRYASVLPRSLKAAALAYHAIARTSALHSIFKTIAQYDVLETRFRPIGNRIIQGTQIKPVLSVRTNYGLAHAGLDVSVTISHASSAKTSRKLTWNAENQQYVTDEFYNTANLLGEVTFDYVIRWLVADLGKDLTLELHETKTIGYDLSIRPKAIHAGKEIEPKGTVAIGTEFSFDLRLGTLKNPKPTLVGGDFLIVFGVKDSSDIIIHQKSFDARGNSAAISFSYTLTTSNIPAGDIKFTFEIGTSDGIHTTDSVTYSLPLTMVASKITFKNFEGKAPVYKIGDTVEVTTVPGSLPDLRTVKSYPDKDVNGGTAKRNFFMDVHSAETHVLLFSLPGTSIVDHDEVGYTFQLPVSPTFYAIGNNIVSFHYETASGTTIPLQLYDSAIGELYEDGAHLNYSVRTELHLANVKNAPQDGRLDYGNEVKFSFQVIDSVSKQAVFSGDKQTTVYLVLRHQHENSASLYTSNKQPAVQITEAGKLSHFYVSWSVNPNAVKGKGFLVLVAQGADGQEIPILNENAQSLWKVNIEIGGELRVDENHFSSEVDDDESVFFIDLALSCQQKQLSDAELVATVNFLNGKEKKKIYSLPVNHGREAGSYQLSWFQPTSAVKSGQYLVEFYRHVDQLRVAEKGADLESLEPLFVVNFFHNKASTGFFIRSEVIALLALGGAFIWMVYQKMEIEGLRKTKKGKK